MYNYNEVVEEEESSGTVAKEIFKWLAVQMECCLQESYRVVSPGSSH